MSRAGLLIWAGVLFAASAALAEMKQGPAQNQQPNPPTQARPANADRGQQVFKENCSRCHHAPEGFSQHISGTIARHMHVRAGLSDADYKALLRFLNP